MSWLWAIVIYLLGAFTGGWAVALSKRARVA